VQKMSSDMLYRQGLGVHARGTITLGDARACDGVPDSSVDLVITSPPYANNYDYADAMRLEMTFFGEVDGWADLHHKVRRGLITSCSQHASLDGLQLNEIFQRFSATSILPDLRAVSDQLAIERTKHGGKKDYHLMVAAYFADMQRVWTALRRVCKPGSSLCWVVGDSAPYGVHVPVDRWLGELAKEAGFHTYSFEKVRDRNTKWKNRKHRVPLCEGRLWVFG
jgi:DNA modification methylase